MIEMNKKGIGNVITWDGREVPAENCRRIGKTKPEYYEINRDCFYVFNDIKGKYEWFRLNTGKISFNYETQKYELTKNLQDNEDLVKGIYDENNNEGYFKINPITNVVLTANLKDKVDSGVICRNRDIALKLGYEEYFGNGCYVKYKELGLSKAKIQQKLLHRYDNVKKLAYNADNNNSLYLKIIEEYNQNKKYIELSEHTTQASKLFPYSVGAEFESSTGIIPRQMLGLLGVVPLKDGSLRKEDGSEPYEYTTIPLSGSLGLETIKNLTCELNKRCEFDEKCSMHIHLGGVTKRTEEFVIAFYKLCYKLQNEIFDMFPLYKSYPEKYVMNFHKNYCQKLPDLQLEDFNFNSVKNAKEAKTLTKQAFDRIYYWLSDNQISVTDEYWNLNTLRHPKGELDKWYYLSR